MKLEVDIVNGICGVKKWHSPPIQSIKKSIESTMQLVYLILMMT